MLRYERALSEDIVKKMSESGCRYATIGNESGSPEVLTLMRKGVEPEVRNTLLSRLAAAGIGVNLQNFIGFPCEAKEQALETVRFLLSKKNVVMSVVLGGFVVTHGSPVALEPESFGVSSLELRILGSLYPEYNYQVSSGLQPEVVSELADQHYSFLGLGFPLSSFFMDTPSGAHNLFYLSRYGLDWMRKNLRNYTSISVKGLTKEDRLSWAKGVRWIKHADGKVSIFNTKSGALLRFDDTAGLCQQIDCCQGLSKTDTAEKQKKREKDLASLEREGFLLRL